LLNSDSELGAGQLCLRITASAPSPGGFTIDKKYADRHTSRSTIDSLFKHPFDCFRVRQTKLLFFAWSGARQACMPEPDNI
jgi:hypothetical protein